MHAPKPVTSALLNARGKKHKMRCSGVKQCEYLQDSLRSLRHTIVSEETWGLIQRERAALDRSDPDIRKRNANRYRTGSKSI